MAMRGALRDLYFSRTGNQILEIEVMGVWREEILLHGGRVPIAVGQMLSLRSETVAFSLKLYKMTPKEP